MQTVGVLGSGAMGAGIAQVCATSGYRTIVRDVNESALQSALAHVTSALAREVEVGRIAPDVHEQALTRLSGATRTEDLAACDLVIEAVVENAEAKREAFRQIESVLPAHTIIASNTSSLSITMLASTTRRPDRVIGLHFSIRCLPCGSLK